MKKLLFVLLMVLSLVISLPAQAVETPIASFDFDTEPTPNWTTYSGTGAVAEKTGNPQWVAEHDGHEGVMSFDGASSLQLFADADHTPLLKDYTTLTISFDFFDSTIYTNPGIRDIFYAAADDSIRSGYDYLRLKANTYLSTTAYRAGKTDHDGKAYDWNSQITTNFSEPVNNVRTWHSATLTLTLDGLTLTIDGQQTVSQYKHVDLPTILGSDPVLFLGTGMANDSTNFIGYIDNLKITGSTEPLPEPEPDPDPNPNPNPNPDPNPDLGPSFALNPFNNLGSYRPSLYNGITLSVDGNSTERAIIPIPEGNTVTLPSDATRESFTIGDKTCAIKGNAQNPRKLIGWYNIATGDYYSVANGKDVTVTLDPDKNNVFYGDWIASSYDFLGTNTNPDDLITTADTSDFININVFDYSDLVNVNSMNVDQNGGLYSESWSVYDNRENGWLAFSDWGTYKNNGSIGFPNNRDGSVHGYTGVNANPGILNPADKIISTMFNTASKPGAASYVPGINYLGKGNYLFSYDPASGMYSYDCASNAAVYQQNVEDPDKSRFYVYKNPLIYNSDGVQHDFFPLNVKPDNDKFKLDKENGNPNYWFGMDFTMDFWLPDNSGSGGNKITTADGDNSPMIFTFVGDDDMWVLIDGKLVLDIGGIHDPVEGTINFSTGEVIVKNENGATTTSIDFTAGDHTMEIYYLERGGDKSNCTIKFNLLPEYEVEEPGIDTVKIVKEWVGNPPTMPAEITVELYDENNPKDVIKTATLAPDEEGNWSHSFSNLPHKNAKDETIKYSVREKNSNPNFQVNVDGEVHVYSNAWVFTDQAGLKNEKYVVIGNGKGKVLGVDLKAHGVTKMDEDNNIIVQLASTKEATQLLWEIEPATSYPGGKHFYLKNGDQYLCIKLPDGADNTKPELHLHGADDATQPSVFYLNASGDLQDATTGHRLVAANGGFGVNTNVGGNVTVESANKASLYVLRESETTAYSFIITNTYVDPNVPMGTLQISKTIGGNAANADDEFTFLVTLKDANGSLVTGTFDKYQFINGQCEVTLTGDEAVTIMLPEGAHYTVTEKDANGYQLITPAGNKYEGTIKLNQPAKCPFHNEKNRYSLTVSKTVSGNAADTTKDFDFTVTLTDADDKVLTGKFGEYTFDEKGQAVISIAHGESFTITELPEGTKYAVSENSDGYIQTAPATKEATGTITAGENAVAFVNELNLYSLTVSKSVSGNAADTKKPFPFTVTLTDTTGAPLTGEFGEYTFDTNGQCTISIAHGQSFTIKELPVGTKYAISEDSDGYIQTAPATKEATGTITTGENKVAFTNVRNVVRLVKVTEPAGLTVAPEVTVTGDDGSVVTAEALTANDDKAYLEIPVKPGVTYTVTEYGTNIPGYAFAGSALATKDADVAVKDMTFTIAKNDLEAIPTLTLTNTYAQGGLTVSKTVKGNAADANDEFVFTVTLTDKDGKPVSGTFGKHTFTDGQCKITLKGGESENFADLPIGVTYTVTETPAAGYVQTAPTAPATGVISTEAAVVSFTNERWAIDIEKKAVGLTGTDTVAPKVTVGDVVIDALPADGATKERVYVTPGQTYTVTEANADVKGYTLVSAVLAGDAALAVTNDTMGFTFPKEGMTTVPTLTLTNTYAQGGLTVSKTVKGNAADANDEFLFTVTLTDKDGNPVSGTFGEHAFVNGQCTFTLKGGESENFADLPIGVTYTVTETPALGYVQTEPTTPATGVITTDPALVSFTNERWAINIEKVAVGLSGTDTVAPKVTVGDVVIDELPADGVSTKRIFVTPGLLYAVTEENAEVAGYTLVSTELTTEDSGLTIKDMGFTLSADSTEIPLLTLKNAYAQGGLTVSKTVKGNAADKNDQFTFTVTLTDAEGNPVSGTFGEHAFVNGQCTFTLKGGESKSFADLPIGVTYTVTEAPALGYVQTEPTAPATGVITTDPALVSFTNERDVVRLVKVTDPAGLTVAPKVTVTGSDGSVVTAEALTANNAAKYLEIPVKPGVTYTVAESGQEVAGYTLTGSTLTAKDADVAVTGMTFTVAKSGMTTVPVLTLTNSYTLDSVTVTIRKVSTGLAEGVAYPAPKVSIYAANSTTPVWTGTLTPNGSALPVKLQPGTYTVKEVIDEVEGYGFTSILYVNGAASADNTFTLAANAVNTELHLDNFYAAEFSTLTLTKTVTGESGSKTAFSFRITLTDDAGKPITERFPYTGTMDGAAPLTGVVTSGSTIALRDGGSITVQLPLGVHYQVEEQEQAGYVLVSSEGEKGVITKEGAKSAFVNKPQYTVTVTKTWEGDTAETRPASVQVQLMLNGKPVGDPVTLSAANGWKITYTGLDAKGPYTVDELTVAEGYVSTVEEGEGNTFVITNSYIVIPPTGDAAHPALYLLALAGSAALLMLLRKRKAA